MSRNAKYRGECRSVFRLENSMAIFFLLKLPPCTNSTDTEVLENASLTKCHDFRETTRLLLHVQCAISEIPDEYISAIDHYEAAARTDIPVMVYRSNNRQHAQ